MIKFIQVEQLPPHSLQIAYNPNRLHPLMPDLRLQIIQIIIIDFGHCYELKVALKYCRERRGQAFCIVTCTSGCLAALSNL